jgi:superfamily II DNA or RNA helicase
MRVITPFDCVERTRTGRGCRIVSLPRWRRAFRSLLHHAFRHHSYASLRTAAAADIELLPHQLAPAIAVLRGEAARVLIADEVGLGKTIQSALIVAELRARHAADRVLVLAPAGLRGQWARELAARFGIDAVIMDARRGRALAAALPLGLNPWTTLQVAVSSIDYVKRPEVLASVCAVRWDVVVIDEAHSATLASDRRAAAHAVCERAAYVVLLTATPHNGDSAAFESLCGIGAVAGDRLAIFRRMRRDTGIGGERRVHRLRVSPTTAERRMFGALTRLTAAVSAEGASPDSEAALAMGVLQKRALSSAYSLAASIERRLALASGEPGAGALQLRLPLATDDELDAADSGPIVSSRLLQDEATEHRLLTAAFDAATAAVTSESKVAALRRLLRRLARLGERAIVFTEYRDTLEHVRQRLRADSVLIHGGMTADERDGAVAAFTRGGAAVMLATDAAGEGLNLQGACRVVINLELPWNPMRLEQRIGRVDRIGQTRRVHAFHLIARETEMQLLARLQHRVSAAAAVLPITDPLGSDTSIVPAGVAASKGATSLPASGCLQSQPPTPVEHIEEHARAEHQRLIMARRLAVGLDPRGRTHLRRGEAGLGLDVRDVLVARSIRRRTRMALGARDLVVDRQSLSDPAGETVAVRVVGVLLPGSGAAQRQGRRQFRTRAAALGQQCAEHDTIGGAAWTAEARQSHAAFWSRRAERERAIRGRVAPAEPAQRGLFDRRADRQLDEIAAREREFVGACESRIASAQRVECVDDCSPALILLS